MSNWKEQGGKLIKEFKFPDYQSATYFVTKVAEIAEKINHHPDIELSWGRVRITTTTHDAGNRITEKDKKLVSSIDKLGPEYQGDLIAPSNFAELKQFVKNEFNNVWKGIIRTKEKAKFYYDMNDKTSDIKFVNSLKRRLKSNSFFWLINSYPYDALLQNLPQVSQWILWFDTKSFHGDFDKEIQNKFPGFDYCYNESERKSVPEIRHIHVFVDLSSRV